MRYENPKPRLVLVISALGPGGAERVALHLARGLSQRDWHVTVLTVQDSSEDFYRAPASVERLSLAEELPKQFRRRRGPRWFRATRYALALLRLRPTLRRIQPDVVLSFLTEMNVLVTSLMIGTKIPVVVSERNHPPLAKVAWHWRLLRKYTYGLAENVIALTQESAEWIRENTKSYSVSVVPNPVVYPLPVTEPAVVPSSVVATLAGSRTMLTAGRLTHQKGFDRLLRAFAEVNKGSFEWNLVITGDGPLRGDLEAEVDALGLREYVALPGVVGNLGDWFAYADLFAQTSLYEGFPNVLVEALAHGCPAVAVDCDTGPRDIVRHEIDGLLVPQDDHQKLIGALKRMMGDIEFREACATNAPAVRSRFSPEMITSQYESILEEACIRKR